MIGKCDTNKCAGTEFLEKNPAKLYCKENKIVRIDMVHLFCYHLEVPVHSKSNFLSPPLRYLGGLVE